MFETLLAIVIAALAYCLGRQAGRNAALEEINEILETAIGALEGGTCTVEEDDET